jgi:DNA-binding response OmpR family regulator
MAAILVVEDDEVLASAIVDTLMEAGFEVTWAKSGEDGISQMQGKKFDLVLLDIMLPGIDGYETLRQIKADHNMSSTKVVMLTNLGQMSEINRALDLGATDYVIKANVDLARLVELTKNKFLVG